MIRGKKLATLIKHSSQLIECGDIEALAYRFREDAVMSAAGQFDTKVVQGRADVIRLLKTIRQQFKSMSVMDVATDTILYVMVVKADDQMLCVVVEPDPETLLIKRLLLCRSIMPLIKE